MGHEEDALDYHQRDSPGKLETSTTKPVETEEDLSLAYTPGVAAPSEEIADDADEAYTYTAKGYLVGIVSDGSAVLELGEIGAQAAKPVIEGKSVLFKQFADINSFDIELDSTKTDDIVFGAKLLEPTFGGLTLEDIGSPKCFEIENTLRDALSIPVFHDDQHGTAIISGAALLNAANLLEKDPAEMEVAFAGTGAAATATAGFYESLGISHENILLCDEDGILTEERAETDGVNDYTGEFARDVADGDLEDAMEDADAFIGLSVGGIVSQEMVRSMAENPIVFAMANPDPEIGYEEATEARDDTIIMATGRSDNPNQVNNVLGFPYIFRGALDIRADSINGPMKLAAARALADLAQQDVSDEIEDIYDESLEFGPEYIIPKPLDHRLLYEVAPAVADAAMNSGVARTEIDLDEYTDQLEDEAERPVD